MAGERSATASRHGGRVLASSLAIVAVLALSIAPTALARDNSWTLAWSPATIVEATPTSVAFVARNTSDGGGGGEIGCIEIVVPTAFVVNDVSLTAAPAGTSWVASAALGPGLATTVRVHATGSSSVLEGDPDDDQVGFTIRVTSLLPGSPSWVADAFNKAGCTNDMHLTKTVKVTVVLLATPKPTAPPTPTPTPTQAPTPTPAPTGAAPTPTPTPTPAPTAPATTPPPTIEPTHVPGATAAPGSSTAPTGTPAPSPTPVAGPIGAVASDEPPTGSSAPDASASPGPETAQSPPPGIGGTGIGAGVAGSGGNPPPGSAFSIGGPDTSAAATRVAAFDDTLTEFTTLFGRAFDWAVPGLVLSVPGLLLILAVAAQAIGALAWLPLVRRRIGGFGIRSGGGAGRS